MDTVLKRCAILLGILGIIGSIVLGNAFPAIDMASEYRSASFNFPVFMTGVLASSLAALLLYAFGHAISLLQTIADRTNVPVEPYALPFHEVECPICGARQKTCKKCYQCGARFVQAQASASEQK